jgi:hypothetical protein
MVSGVQKINDDTIAQSSIGSSVLRGLRQLTLAITLPLLLLATSYEAATAGEIKATTAQGIVTFRAPTAKKPPPRKRQRITVRATANGVVTFQRTIKCVPPEFLKNGACERPPTRITIAPSKLPTGTVASTYRTTRLSATGGKRPYKFALADGKLPPGLRLTSAGKLAGTPTKRGAFGIIIRVTDAQKFTGTRAYSIAIRRLKCVLPEVLRNGTCVRPPVISIAPSELPGGNVNTNYTGAQLVANGGRRPHTFSLADGPLPPGLRLSSTGALTGTPTTAGAFGIIVKALDARKFAGTRAYSITIRTHECAPPEVLRNETCVRPPVISIAPSELPGGKVKSSYPTVRLVANGGKRPHTFALVDGAFPSGLNLETDGTLAGTPTKAGAYSVIVEATDAQKFTGTRAYSVSIAAPIDTPKAPAPTITISPSEIPGGEYDTPYTARQFVANGGSRPYTYKVADGPLPPGLSLSTSGLLEGTPTKRGAFNIVISATDAKKFVGLRAYSLSIADGPAETDCPEGQVRFGSNCVNDGTRKDPRPLPPVVIKDPPRLKPCARNYYRNDKGRCLRESKPVPRPCARGKNRNSRGKCVSAPCGRGKYRNNSGRCVQEPCGRGKIRNNSGRCVSAPCGRGKLRNNSGRCVLQRCDRNQYRDNRGRCRTKQTPKQTPKKINPCDIKALACAFQKKRYWNAATCRCIKKGGGGRCAPGQYRGDDGRCYNG